MVGGHHNIRAAIGRLRTSDFLDDNSSLPRSWVFSQLDTSSLVIR